MNPQILLAEWHKVRSTPSIYGGLLASMIPLATFLLAYLQTVNLPEAQGMQEADLLVLIYQNLILMVMAPLMLGAFSVGMEYAHADETRPDISGWTITLLACPKGWPVLIAKLIWVWVLVIIAFVFAATTLVSTAQLMSGIPLWAWILANPIPLLGVGIYWIILGTMGYSVVLLVGSVPIPLTLLILNFSVASIGLLFARASVLVRFLPDLAIAALVFPSTTAENTLINDAARASLINDPQLNQLVLLVWLVVPFAVAVWRFSRSEGNI